LKKLTIVLKLCSKQFATFILKVDNKKLESF